MSTTFPRFVRCLHVKGTQCVGANQGLELLFFCAVATCSLGHSQVLELFRRCDEEWLERPYSTDMAFFAPVEGEKRRHCER
jgi:hypothetical protein